MNGIKISDVTAVVVNWLTAENTLHAVESFRKFYPDVPVFIVDDDSSPDDKSEFLLAYNNNNISAERLYDPDTTKLVGLKGNIFFLQYPKHRHRAKGEGHCIDLVMKNIATRWMFHFHSDYRFHREGILEEMMGEINKSETPVGAIGESKTKHPKLPALTGVVELVNVEAGKIHGLSYEPIKYFEDGTFVLLFDEKPGGSPIAAGGYYTGRLFQLGYKILTITNISTKYGRHLRWEGDENLWNRYF